MEKIPQLQDESLINIDITSDLVSKLLKELDPTKAQGPDGLPAKVLKELHNEISVPLSILFQNSVDQGKIPNEWKKAEVIALFKKGSKTDPGNYRPVSLTCITCKVLEKIIRDAIVKHFTQNKLYSECQHGFRTKRSCITQLLEAMEYFTSKLDIGESVDVIYLDFKKAFDTVPHARLMIKLSAYGLNGKLKDWINNFLSNRTQRVRVGTSVSQEAKVLSGIPQGSILGPILFTIFINDLPEKVKSVCKIFADDTKLYNISNNSTDLQNDLNVIMEWSQKWKLDFNIQKCKTLHIGNKNPKHKYYMKTQSNQSDIIECDNEKDLGVIFDKSLKFDTHIQKAVAKGNQVIGLIRRSFDFIDKDVFLKLYTALVRPHLEYGNVIWHPNLKRQSISLEKVQKRATKMVKECKNMTYSQRLKYLNLPSLKGRRLRGDLIQTYKILKNIDDIDSENLFTKSLVTKTRNSQDKLYLSHCNTNLRKYCFTNRVIMHWNALSPSIKSAPNLNKFKNLLDSDAILNKLFFDFDMN